MNFYVYILFSDSTNSYYKGQTKDILERLRRHNNGYEKATKNGIPWKLVWCINKETRSEALLLERKLKNLSTEKTVKFIEKYAEESRALMLRIGLRSGY